MLREHVDQFGVVDRVLVDPDDDVLAAVDADRTGLKGQGA
jgi:hypothetical protein